MNRCVVLFDVDGTLVRTAGVGAAAIESAVGSVLGHLPDVSVNMGGKTDPQIVREYLEAMNEDHHHSTAILEQLEKGLAAVAHEIAANGRALPGVPELLVRLHDDERVVSTVLTGNLAPNAVVKLAAFGLDRWLDLESGAYGSDDEDRRALVPVALGRVAERHGVDLGPDRVWVVGDTPRDLECARAGGVRCLLVGTGAFPSSELAALGADAVRDDLLPTDEVYGLLTSSLG